jgi:hypothetical protein
MSFFDQQQLANSSDFQLKVRHAMLKSAIAIMAETMSADYHEERAAFAQVALGEPERTGQRVAQCVVTNDNIDSESSDADIEYTVNTMWNALSGVILPAP